MVRLFPLLYNNLVVTPRRQFLSLAAAGLAGCRPRRGSGFPGYAFVADQAGESLAAVDLTAFALTRHIPLGASPSEVIADPARKRAYVLTPASGLLHEIDPAGLAVRRRVRVAQRPLSMRPAPGGGLLWVSCAEPRQLAGVSLERFQVERRIPLPAEPDDFELAPDGRRCVVTHGPEGTASLVDFSAARPVATTNVGVDAGRVLVRMDGKIALVAGRDRRMICVLETASGKRMTSLQIALRPEHMSFKPDGGEMFVTGEGMDAVVIVNPYYNEVAETVLAGRAPAAMAFSRRPEYLFVVNPPAGDVTILDPETRRLVAVAAVGSDPAFVTLTPGDEYALILNRSGTMAVIRPAAVVPRRTRGAPLFTTIPVGSRPVHAAVLAV